jgi:cobalamin biosynthesis protein CobT
MDVTEDIDDDDINNWLDKLDDDSDSPTQSEDPSEDQEPAENQTEESQKTEPEQVAGELVESESTSKQVIKVSAQSNESELADVSKSSSTEFIDTIIKKFESHTDQVWDALMADRKQLDQYIAIFTDKVSNPEEVKSCYVEALTSLLTTKASTSTNASKFLDSISKIISAVKSMKSEGSRINLSELLGGSDDGSVAYDEDNP